MTRTPMKVADGETRIPLYVHDAGYDEAPLTWDLRGHLHQVQVLVRLRNDRVLSDDAGLTSAKVWSATPNPRRQARINLSGDTRPKRPEPALRARLCGDSSYFAVRSAAARLLTIAI